ncbi:hypothetical protein JANAI62_34100 [Jannaschia pagri]|uniref:Uncharacterized protein n=1 Tax=Jannaschia pagri TaxID=2829797 RepID=A0ABQ4NQU7_9RHOB|nr:MULTISPECIES: hypothetical protein [unclassified Jannaschia]GIT92952.1 hypothetical protein JANAI61_34100 [Jannaschia sp. AI_61]GIT96787.1 hypothetical protein JANAI62_34100 [Jannaschia sp. AI_62]
MTVRPIIYIEHIRHDPMAGTLSGTAVRRRPNGEVIRQHMQLRIAQPIRTHDEAVRRLTRAATADC